MILRFVTGFQLLCFLLGCMGGGGLAWAANGSAYQGYLSRQQFNNLMDFYRRYIARPTASMAGASYLIKDIRKKTEELRSLGEQASSGRCKPDCALVAEVDRSLMDANATFTEARKLIRADTDWLVRMLGVETDANGELTDAQIAYEWRKVGFDMSMIVAKTFQMDFGPLVSQLAKDLGAGNQAAGGTGLIGSGASDAGRFLSGTASGKALGKGEFRKITLSDLKRSGAYALIKEAAGKLMEGSNPSEQFASSLTQNLVSGVIEKANELASEGKEFTPAGLAQVVLMSALNAWADAKGKQLEQDVESNRQALQDSEARRLLWAAEFRSVMTLRRKLYHKVSAWPASGLAVDANWEAGRFRVAAARLCPPGKKPPRLAHAPDKLDSKNFRDVGPALARAEAALRRASETLSLLLEKQKQCLPGIELAGRVKDDKGAAIAGADVSVTVGGKRYTGKSGKDGHYQIRLPDDVEVPSEISLTASKHGYATGSTTVSKLQFQHADITLSGRSANIIDIAPELHHLGNGKYGGAINSQFQRPDAEGVSLKKTFTVQESVLFDPHRRPFLVMEAKGLEEDNPVLLNGKQVAVLASSDASGAASRIELAIDACALKVGENVLEIHATDANNSGNVDDFEIANVQLHFRKVAQQASTRDAKMTPLDGVRILAGDSEQPVKKIAVNERFIIEGKGKGACGVRPDLATVFVFPQSGGEEAGRSVTLVETGPDTGVFRAEQPMQVSDVPAKAGDRIVVRAGLRAASALVTPTAEEAARQAKKRKLLDAAAQAEREYNRARQQWKQLSDFIDEKRARGENVDDLMANLRKLAEKVQQTRARAVEARRKAGLDAGSITVGGKPWNGAKAPAKP